MPARKLAIFLGPYRNLSTLTAAVLSLHPDIQVLNHAAKRFWTEGNDLDFLASPDAATLGRFIDAGWTLSADGERGTLGGSILHSHAYDSDDMKALYHDRYGGARVKPEAHWLAWKESMRVQARLMAAPGLFERLCASFPDLRFILPLRNPLDCAVSNIRTAHTASLGLGRDAGFDAVFGAVIEAFTWALEKRDEVPGRVFAFTQKQSPEAIFGGLAAFLGIDAPPQWLADAGTAFVVREGYPVDPRVKEAVRQATLARLGRWPELARDLA